ncbi:MAG TPA: hypothetical protein VH682_03570 [Gemmataceae bacterium]|jgi:hypothetical protein
MSRYFILIVAFGLLVGCHRSKSSSPSNQQGTSPSTPPPASTAVSVELSNPKFMLKKDNFLVYRFDYRFVKGKPEPEKWYRFLGEILDKNNKGQQAITYEVLGKELQQQGTVDKYRELYHPETATAYTMKLSISDRKGFSRLEDVISTHDLEGKIEPFK